MLRGRSSYSKERIVHLLVSTGESQVMLLNKNLTPQKLAVDIAGRSSCSVQVGAVIVDRKGRLLSWGWNSMGSGYGCCAERSAVLRSNRKRLPGSTVYVAGFRSRNGNPVMSRPCIECQRLIKWAGIKQAIYFTRNGWEEMVC